MADYSEAITAAVQKWLTLNKAEVMKAVSDGINNSTEQAVDAMAGAVMVKVGKFFETNKDELVAAIATAIAVNWQARQHPLPKG